MKKALSVIISLMMVVAVCVCSAGVVYAADNVGSIETTVRSLDVKVEVNGAPSKDVTYDAGASNPYKLKFSYNGKGTLIGWEFPGMNEGTDFEILSEEGNSIEILVSASYDDEVIANAIVKFDAEESTTKKPASNSGATSPETGVLTATGLGVAGAGAAILLAIKKKDDAE